MCTCYVPYDKDSIIIEILKSYYLLSTLVVRSCACITSLNLYNLQDNSIKFILLFLICAAWAKTVIIPALTESLV